MRADLGPGRRFPLDCPQRRRWMRLAGRWRRPRVSGGAMGGGTSIARIASCANRSRQSLQDWSRVGAVTPGIHLRWLPGARVEFPYREPHDGGRIRERGDDARWALWRVGVAANEFRSRWGPRRWMCLAGRWRRPRDSGGAMGGGTSIARIASGAYRNRQSLQDWSRVGAVTPGIHLRWLPGARLEFPYREPHDGVRIRDRGTTPDGRCGESSLRRVSFVADGGRGGWAL